MRILIHGINFRPELVGIGKYTGEMADWLAQRGHEVRVVTAPPFNPEGKVHNGHFRWRYRKENPSSTCHRGAVTVYRCPLWVSRIPTAISRVVHLTSFALSSLPVMLGQIVWRPSLVIVVEPTVLCAPAALVTAALSAACSWLHVQDFEVDAGFAVGMLKSNAVKSLLAVIENKMLGAFDRISTISPKMLDRLSEKGFPSGRAVLFPNWVDTSRIFPLNNPSPLRRELGISCDAAVALYSGSMGRKQGLEILAETARRLAQNHKIQFVFCGEGAYRESLARRCASLANVTWLPLQPADRLNDLLNLADIHLLPQSTQVADLVMPSKLTGMFASGRPVITTAAEGTQLALAIENCGLRVAVGDVDALVDSIVRLTDDVRLRSQLGSNARRFAETTLDKEKILETIEQEFFRLTGDFFTKDTNPTASKASFDTGS